MHADVLTRTQNWSIIRNFHNGNASQWASLLASACRMSTHRAGGPEYHKLQQNDGNSDHSTMETRECRKGSLKALSWEFLLSVGRCDLRAEGPGRSADG